MNDIKKLLFELNPWWIAPFRAEGLFRRARYLNVIKRMLSLPHIVVLAGPRRAGKTSLLRILIADFLSKDGVDPLDILYLSFDDPLLGQYIGSGKNLDNLLEEYEYIRKKQLDKNVIIIIDEIQAIKEWPVWIKKYYDQGQYRFIISGSSASLIKDRFTELTGRSINIEVYPFDFKEFVEFTFPISIPSVPNFSFAALQKLRDFLLPHEKKIKICFEEFKEKGGFPEIIKSREKELWGTVLKNYFDQILYRDIVRTHRVKEVAALENLALYLLQNISQKFSLRNIAKSIDANVELVRTFLQYLMQSYLFFVVGYYGGSLKTTLKKMKKIYALDMGLRHSIVGHKGLDDGFVMENVLFLALRDNFEKIYYWYDRNARELDFVVRRKEVFYAIEVKYADHKLEASELRGLFSFLDKKRLDSGWVVTKDVLKQETIDGKNIFFVPAWLFCLMTISRN